MGNPCSLGRRFLQQGARVIVADIQRPPQRLLDDGAVFLELDVTDRDQVINGFANAEAAVGKLHVIIHNAGKPGKGKHLTESDEEVLGKRGIRCNAVAPGPVRTPMLPPGHVLNSLARNLSALGRIAEVDDLVGVYHFLASDQSKYITSQTVVVDGGRLAGFRTEVLSRLAG
jgi:NAD(P)-dependent dehydrogenase (short-subunit alcohol dehydrogenase family)